MTEQLELLAASPDSTPTPADVAEFWIKQLRKAIYGASAAEPNELAEAGEP
jgi:hypothetical protein